MDTVYLTENAFRDIVLETAEFPHVETGGILIGESTGNAWYVVEVLDPGPRASRSVAYFEYNHTYATHLANKVARRYQSRLRLLGLWHRHPGSLDTFSSVDDDTHREYLRLLQGGFVSMLVNIDPDFRMTFYRVDAGHRQPRYEQVRCVIGDQNFPPQLLALKKASEVAASLSRPAHREPHPVPPVRRQPPTQPQHLPPPQPIDPRQRQAIDQSMRIEYQQPVQPPPRPVQPTAQQPPVETPRPGIINSVCNLIWPRQGEVVEEVRVAPHYAAYDGEEQQQVPQRRASAEQRNLLDMLDAEFDYLDANAAIFQYNISPQEPGFRLEVKLLMTPTRPPYPSRVEFMFYYRQSMPVVAVDGREQPYQPGLLRRWYAQFDAPPPPPPPAPQPVTRGQAGDNTSSAQVRDPRHERQQQEPRNDPPSSQQRPRP